MKQPFIEKEEKHTGIWLSMLRLLPMAASKALTAKTDDLTASRRLRSAKLRLDWDETAAGLVRARVDELLRGGVAGCLSKHEASLQIGSFEQRVIDDIREAVQSAGSSNLTRTKAYLDIFQEFPELHWAFLAHLVSRNAGWNMTDLVSGQKNELQDGQDVYRTYRFLERSNALIFQDAYPQLLLYAYSKNSGKSLFHLLPKFRVSSFMLPFWEHFWLSRSSSLLAVGLIINEQSYIQTRVIRHPFFRQTVMGKAFFRLNSLCGMNQVLLPYSLPGKTSDEASGGQAKLAGKTLSDFASLSSRIAFGKRLYALLFGLEKVLKGAKQFASNVPHTGSRSDYWPGLFTPNEKEARIPLLQSAWLLNKEYSADELRIYSPNLLEHFADTSYEPITREDWLQDMAPLTAITEPRVPFLCAIDQSHRQNILKRAFARDAGKELQQSAAAKLQQR